MRKLTKLALISAFSASFGSQATIVEFQTSQGNFQVNLYDETTPKTVANFLKYVGEESYKESIIHRAVSDFVVQGGGYSFQGKAEVEAIATFPAVENEPKLSNVKGTIAMAKKPGDVNSATSQWFISLTDNSANLDLQNGGFTVFGQVIGEGMTVIDKIAKLSRCGEVPVVNFTDAQCKDTAVKPAQENHVVIYSVTVIDEDPKSAQGLNPKPNTLITQKPVDNGGSSGGALFGWLLAGLVGFAARRRFNQ
ncbi:peptidylprolyl isomerase [Pseudoalteromonas fenneropenaei]|uniref:Peptidyl-prolyl cis-trans isomerase n=1 Tax=Pseudoalteromonas fenneropenaei TaxID=1737459 RepID=A0ABV7CP15_9GAMM